MIKSLLARRQHIGDWSNDQMKCLDLGRYALSVCAAGTLFVGCGGPQTQSWSAAPALQSSAQSSAVLKRAAGGSFNAYYAGHYEDGCDQHGCWSSYSGVGRGTFIKRGSLRVFQVCEGLYARTYFTFQSKRNRAESITAINTQPCSLGAEQYTITGGTGKFANASGDGTISWYRGPYHTFTASFTGTLDF